MDFRLKSKTEIEKMRKAGQIVRAVLDRLGEMVSPGVTTKELNDEAERICTSRGGSCLFKGVPGPPGVEPFPGAICASVNEELVHGIPSDRELKDGDIISVDFGVCLDGWCADAAETWTVGQVNPRVQELVEVTRNALAIAVGMAKPGEYWSNVASKMQDYVEAEGFAIVRDYVGHGIGKEMHEDPQVPNYRAPELIINDIKLQPGLVIAVEPMVNSLVCDTITGNDGWTVVSKDGKPCAHFEDTLAITDDGVSVLTR